MIESIKTFRTPQSFQFESGEQISTIEIAYHSYGKRNADDSNIVWVFHALTGSSDVYEWWGGLFGDECLFNSNDYYIICANVIGSPYGSTMPKDLNFPQFTVRDIVNAHLCLADHLNINKLNITIGGSFGGNQALEFAFQFTGVIEHLILLASSAQESPWAIAVHETQRMALRSDPSFGEIGGGMEGMKAARAIGMLTYRTSKSYDENQKDDDDKLDQFKASSYVQYQGEKFVKRFNPLSYYYLTKCLDSHNLGRGRGGLISALRQILSRTLIIGISSDILVPINLQKDLSSWIPNAAFIELESEYGHDGFLIETGKIEQAIKQFLFKKKIDLKVLKFGGKSLASVENLENVYQHIKSHSKDHALAVVLSARGSTTDQLILLYHLALSQKSYEDELENLWKSQSFPGSDFDISEEKKLIAEKLNAIKHLKFDHPKLKSQVVAFGELISIKSVQNFLAKKGMKVKTLDARKCIITKYEQDREEVNLKQSKELTQEAFETLNKMEIILVTGFIATDQEGRTSNIGRNGSNYTATLLASFLGAKEVLNYTDVDGIFTSNPKHVPEAQKIDHLSYREANELANFGINVIHPKTILPLINAGIPLRILNADKANNHGTLIDKHGSQNGIKAVSWIDEVSLISIEGSGLMGKIGIDSRIFTCLSSEKISIRLISQASTERGIGFVIDKESAKLAERALQKEFNSELQKGEINRIRINNNTSIISIVGRHNYALEKAIEGLRKAKIWVHLFSNSINGENISLVVDDVKMKEALNIVHHQVIGE